MDTPRLFETTNPLEERVGKTFFDELPTTPGVYKMYGRNGALHYVGKAKNLRRRLFTYRRVNHGNSSRKTRRLVRMTYAIEIEQCPTEQAALLKENALIRTQKPEFNHAKKSPETYYFLTMRPEENYLDFRLSMQEPGAEERGYTYGAFKGHRTVRKGTGALLRQLYLLEHNVQTVFGFPTVLTNKLTPLAYQLPINDQVITSETFQQSLVGFLEGHSLQFIESLVSRVHERQLFGDYIGRLILKDCESLKRFYDHCLKRNYELKQQLKLEADLIPQQKLDDYLTEAAFRKD